MRRLPRSAAAPAALLALVAAALPRPGRGQTAAACPAGTYQSERFVLACDGSSGVLEFSNVIKEDVVVIGTFRTDWGIRSMGMTLQADVDIDLELVNNATGDCVIGLKPCLYQAGSSSITYLGMSLAYTGNAVKLPVNTTIWVNSPLTRTVSFEFYALASGAVKVSYWVGPLSPCSSVPPGCSDCSTYQGCAPPLQAQCPGGAPPVCFAVETSTTTTTSTPTTTTATSTTTRTSTSTTTSTRTVTSGTTSTTSSTSSTATTSTTSTNSRTTSSTSTTSTWTTSSTATDSSTSTRTSTFATASTTSTSGTVTATTTTASSSTSSTTRTETTSTTESSTSTTTTLSSTSTRSVTTTTSSATRTSTTTSTSSRTATSTASSTTTSRTVTTSTSTLTGTRTTTSTRSTTTITTRSSTRTSTTSTSRTTTSTSATATATKTTTSTGTNTTSTTSSTTTTTQPCPIDQYQAAAFVLDCKTGATGGQLFVQKTRGNNEVQALILPAGMQDVQVSVSSVEIDVDLHIVDATTGECIAGFRCTYGMSCGNLSDPCIDTDAVLMSFSGVADTTPVDEVAVLFEVRRDLRVVAKYFGTGNFTMAITAPSFPTCSAQPPGCSRCSDYTECAKDEWAVCDGSPRVQCLINTTTSTGTSTETTSTMTSSTSTFTTKTSSTSSTLTTITSSTSTRTSTTATTSTSSLTTSTSSMTTTINMGCNRTSFMGAAASNTTCPEWIEVDETCTLLCGQGQQAVGQFRCTQRQILGRPLCLVKDQQYRVNTKVAGVLHVVADMTGPAARRPALASVLSVALAGAGGVAPDDVAVTVQVAAAAAGRLLTDATTASGPSDVEAQYEILVRDIATVPTIKQNLLTLQSWSQTDSVGVAVSFAKYLLYAGIRARQIYITSPPADFQDTVLVEPAPQVPATVPVEYRLRTGRILGAFLGAILGLTAVACGIHWGRRRWRKEDDSSDLEKE